MKRSTQIEIVNAVQSNDWTSVVVQLSAIRDDKSESPNWRKFSARLIATIADGKPRFSVFTIGNSKLPFVAFSSLALATCPGAGECANFCYSLRAWRYPAAFFRQVQNAFLTAHHFNVIESEMTRMLSKRRFVGKNAVDFRLFVDGDFDSIETMGKWFQLLESFPVLRTYGYSKSWELFLQWNANGKAFPHNYVLNISSGSRYNDSMKTAMLQLPVTRGEFIAVQADVRGFSAPRGDYATKAYRDAVRASFPDKKAFVCPGKCGTCTGAGHACGMLKLKNIPIVIGIH